ncbi:hypothetical protein [Algirhabdus cladophorae]|uniref:hypothetical protein n=1 Tax=Algirhabdus cladophorae TaxID=3377108 RepID=UPI003B846EFB
MSTGLDTLGTSLFVPQQQQTDPADSEEASGGTNTQDSGSTTSADQSDQTQSTGASQTGASDQDNETGTSTSSASTSAAASPTATESQSNEASVTARLSALSTDAPTSSRQSIEMLELLVRQGAEEAVAEARQLMMIEQIKAPPLGAAQVVLLQPDAPANRTMAPTTKVEPVEQTSN